MTKKESYKKNLGSKAYRNNYDQVFRKRKSRKKRRTP